MYASIKAVCMTNCQIYSDKSLCVCEEVEPSVTKTKVHRQLFSMEVLLTTSKLPASVLLLFAYF